MKTGFSRAAWMLAGAALVFGGAPAAAHHPMGGTTPSNLMEGLLSGFGHPIIGLDHLAAVIAVGCLAGLHRSGAGLVVGYVLAMMGGVAAHLLGVNVPAAEALVALTVIALGGVMLWARPVGIAAALVLFAVTGLLHGYALGESIVGAEPTPLVAYLAGLAVIQTAIGISAMLVLRFLADPAIRGLAPLRAAGAAVACVGLVGLAPRLFGG